MSELDEIRSKRAKVKAEKARLLAEANDAVWADLQAGELAIQRKRLAKEEAQLAEARKVAGEVAPAPAAPVADKAPEAPAPKDAPKSDSTPKKGDS